MHSSNDETKKKHEIDDLPKFFKEKSKEIGKAFSNKVVEISIIRSISVTSDEQEFSFKLRLLTIVDKDTHSIWILR
ncbi:Predicted protein [Wolbachia endosymbiont strain TRS of Brugia malayi]|uniref:hypothetical protein n=1 Tax=Wolbachia endosymbiont of Brugia malayi TaxID=80849 RepID=UPI00004C9267|nr:hypothetical protein [Wolbachia endosymbiont of Brugia malayi]AAW70678.1 Predicted protein [Wolbachia endosymbiont strain TRS of Brugia malayi]